jgi:excisionase family DNA binding protein
MHEPQRTPIEGGSKNSRRSPPSRDSALAYGVADAARVTGVSRSQLYVLMARGELASIKLHGRRLILRTALEELLAGSA